MSTEFTHNEEVVAVRFCKNRKAVVRMEVTESEFSSWKDVVVQGSDGSEMTVAEVCAGKEVFFDNAQRQNEMARQFENHRFNGVVDGFDEMAAECRSRAKECSKQSFSVV